MTVKGTEENELIQEEKPAKSGRNEKRSGKTSGKKNLKRQKEKNKQFGIIFTGGPLQRVWIVIFVLGGFWLHPISFFITGLLIACRHSCMNIT